MLAIQCVWSYFTHVTRVSSNINLYVYCIIQKYIFHTEEEMEEAKVCSNLFKTRILVFKLFLVYSLLNHCSLATHMLKIRRASVALWPP